MKKSKNIPLRSEIDDSDKWNLSKLFVNLDEWSKSLETLKDLFKDLENKRNALLTKEEVLEGLKLYYKVKELEERLNEYAFLLHSTDASRNEYQEIFQKFSVLYADLNSRISFFWPAISKIDETLLKEWSADESFSDYKVVLDEIIRQKPHILSDAEEKILSLHANVGSVPDQVFSLMTDVDFQFDKVKGKELTHSTFFLFMENKDQNIRKEAYVKFYKMYDQYKNTLAAIYSGSVSNDIFRAKARNFKDCLTGTLFFEQIPQDVYHNLISTVNANLGTLHKFYSLKKKLLGLDKMFRYDVYAPLFTYKSKKTSYKKAVSIVEKALAPLGKQYVKTLKDGLLNGWVDRYENKGKSSGAFSAGCYTSDPYILLNYKDSSLNDVFTLAHEGGHSMHSWYSFKNNPYPCCSYNIFVAEVASTFNEELLFRYLLKEADSDLKKYLIAYQADAFTRTIYRQTMFAEFELKAHSMMESGVPLTINAIRSVYQELLAKYFGNEVELLSESNLEALLIPHFYRAFYVYQYATGMAAAVSLCNKVLNGGEKERDDYLSFLKLGGSKDSITSLKIAGVDMSKPEPVQDALNYLASLVDELSSF